MRLLNSITKRKYKSGYVIKEDTYSMGNGRPGTYTLKCAYTHEGLYIGDPKTAYYLCTKKGIKPKYISEDSKVCSIGFCGNEQKWYGWSHRAIYGFGIGSTCKKGDCHYVPKNKKDFIDECTNFWDDEYHVWTKSKVVQKDDKEVVHTTWEYSNDVPNEKIRGTISGVHNEFPGEYGKGEWVAKTLEDAKQMAIDFACSVS